MAPTEHEAIKQISQEVKATRELIGELVAEFRVFKTKLLGDDKGELPTGRIPVLEAQVEKIKGRQDRHERLFWAGSGFVVCLNAIGWIVSLISHISGVFKK